MSVNLSELVFYGAARMTETDGATVGGAVDTSRRIEFLDVSPAGPLQYVSSAAGDNATKIIMSGLDSTGASVTETKTFNGTTFVTGTQSFNHLFYAATSGATANGPLADPGGTNATGTLAAVAQTPVLANRVPQTPYSANTNGAVPTLLYAASGDGVLLVPGTVVRISAGTGLAQLCRVIDNTRYGTDVVAVNQTFGTPLDATSRYTAYQGMLFEILPNRVTAVIRAFSNSSAQAMGGGTNTYYEKVFIVNNDTSTSLTSVTLTIQSETAALPGSSALDIGVNKALNDTATAANRQTLPANGDASAITFTSGAPPQTQNVPSPGNLPSGVAPNAAGAQGIWLRLTLPAGTVPYFGYFDLRPTGVTA